MANPMFTQSNAFKQGQEVGFTPAPPGMEVEGRMTYEGTVAKAASLFLLAVAAAVVVGMFAPGLALPLVVAGLVMAFVTMFATRKQPRPVLFAVTLALYGGAVGGVSVFYEAEFGGIILQALIGTAIVFGVSLGVYRAGWVRNMGKVNKFLAIAMPSYVIFSLVNVGMVVFGNFNMREVEIGGLGIKLGLVLSIFAIFIGALMLISDFDMVDNGVRNGLPSAWEWTAAYGLVFAVIWIYLEMLRLLSYLRR